MADIYGTIVPVGAIAGAMKATYNYNLSTNKPSINGVELIGDTKLTNVVYNFMGILPADGWSDEAPYTQTVGIDGVNAEMSPIIDVILSNDINVAKEEQLAWGCVTKAETNDGNVVFYCYETKPETDINFKIKVV